MSEKERPTYLPELPPTRPPFADYVPSAPASSLAGDEPAPPAGSADAELEQLEQLDEVNRREAVWQWFLEKTAKQRARLAEAGLSQPPAAGRSPETTVPPKPSASTGDTPEQRGRERLTLSGRVGAAPTLRTTPKGTLVARFPLGVHEDSGATTWHTILAFNQRAEQVRTSVKKGDAVEVIGYRHTR